MRPFTASLFTHITVIELLTIMLCWCAIWLSHSHLRNMGAHHCVYVEVVKGYFLKWMSHFTHHSNMGSDKYVCTVMWFCKMNDTLHTSQKYGSSPLCICWGGERLLLKVNVLFHTSQHYGHWPMCMHWRFIMSFFRMNAFLHTLWQ